MMPGLQLEIFEPATAAPPPAEPHPDAATEEARLQGYDQGYAAGWEDATAAQATEQTRLQTELARNLQALSFTYEEARLHVITALGPFLHQLVTRLLPATGHAALAPVIRDTLLPLAEQAADRPLTLRLNPAARPDVEALLARLPAPPLRIEEEPSLSRGQASLRRGEGDTLCETLVDLDRATATIAAAIRDFYRLTTEERP